MNSPFLSAVGATCAQYWPINEGETECYGRFTVANVHVSSQQGYLLTNLTVHDADVNLIIEVAHYQFLGFKTSILLPKENEICCECVCCSLKAWNNGCLGKMYI
jgi:hypothetical protein